MLLGGYTLNAAPLDGTALFTGQSSAAVALAQAATSYKQVHPAFVSSSVALADSSNGLVAITGSGSTPATLTYYGDAYKRAMAQAINEMTLTASGTGNGISAKGSMVYMQLATSGYASGSLHGRSSVDIPLSQAAIAAGVALGTSSIRDWLDVTGRAGLPDPVIIRPQLASPHPTRTLKVSNGRRGMTVAAETVTEVGRQDRTIRISADRST